MESLLALAVLSEGTEGPVKLNIHQCCSEEPCVLQFLSQNKIQWSQRLSFRKDFIIGSREWGQNSCRAGQCPGYRAQGYQSGGFLTDYGRNWDEKWGREQAGFPTLCPGASSQVLRCSFLSRVRDNSETGSSILPSLEQRYS